MPALKNSDRAEVLRRVLEGAFAPRFTAITERIAAHYCTRLAVEHPRFLELMADERARPYVAACEAPIPFYAKEGNRYCFARPAHWGRFVTIPYRRYVDHDCHAPLRPDLPKVPPCDGFALVENEDLVADYLATWEQYVSAQQKLSALLYSYATREKLIADFPEYAHYLPAPTQKAKLPTVIVSKVRAELSALGIPAGESQP